MMSALRRIQDSRMPRVGEVVKILQDERIIAQGYVVNIDRQTISVAGRGIVDLDTNEVRRGLHDGSVRIERGA
ncbi:MAG: hypothetical protein H0X30_11105 [Anaerolineae bacterium]|nr:hypothetical protein [Anaerolineae bacterium]